MANQTGTVKKETGNNLTPIIIIGAIFLATIAGIYMISSSGGDEANTNTASTTNTGGNNTTPASTAVAGYNSPSTPKGAVPANMKGAENSPVVVEEFADFQCPTCGVVHPKMKELMAKYSNRVQFIFRNYPLSQIHKNAYDAAVAAEAAGMQGKFWEMQNLLFTNQAGWSNSQNARQDFAGYAQKLGLDIEKYNNDVLALPTKQRVDNDINRGRVLNITSTPTVLINGTPVPFQQMEVDPMSKLIDAELEKFNQKNESPTKPSEASSNEPANKEETPAK